MDVRVEDARAFGQLAAELVVVASDQPLGTLERLLHVAEPTRGQW
jgi:hypothetical protein